MHGDSTVLSQAMQQLLERYPSDRPGRMLHAPSLTTGGKCYAFAASGGELVVKLSAERVAELVATGTGQACDPRGGRPMRCWVRLAVADEHTATAWLLDARQFVTGQPNHDLPDHTTEHWSESP